MSTNYSKDLAILEAEYKLEAQQSALKRIDIDCLRMKKKIQDYDETRVSLNAEIQKSLEELNTLKGGE